MNYKKSLELIQKFEKRLASSQTLKQQYLYLTKLTLLTLNSGLFDLCREYASKSIEHVEKQGNKQQLPNLLYTLGYSYYHLGIYDKALETLLSIDSLSLSHNNLRYKGLAYSAVGLAYSKMKDFLKATFFFDEAMKLGLQIRDRMVIARAYNAIFVGFSEQQQFDKCLEPLKQGLSIAEELSDPELISSFYNNLGYTYRNLGQFTTALEYLFKCLYIRELSGNVYGLAVVLYNVGFIYYRMEDYAKSLEYYEKSLAYANLASDCSILDLLYAGFADTWEQLKNYSHALEYFKRYTQNHEQVYNNDKTRKFTEMQSRYEIDKKEREAEIYRLKNIELVDVFSKMERQNKELLKINQTKDYILNIVSHDLKNSISAIISSIDLIPEKNDPMITRYILMIKNSADKSLELVQSILTASKIELDDFTLNLQPYEIQTFFADHIEHVKLMAHRKTLNLSLALPKLPVFCALDSARFWEIISNIVSNAVKFTPRNGSISIKGTCVQQQTGVFFKLAIKDSGIGINKDKIARIFDKFTNARRQGTEGEPTTGLGLSIVKRLVQLHNGSIAVVSHVDKGTTVTIKLPVCHP